MKRNKRRRQLFTFTSILLLPLAHPSPANANSLQLVSPANATSGKLAVNPEALEWLRSLPADSTVLPTTIIGPYRTGKSFTLNQIMDGASFFRFGGAAVVSSSHFVARDLLQCRVPRVSALGTPGRRRQRASGSGNLPLCLLLRPFCSSTPKGSSPRARRRCVVSSSSISLAHSLHPSIAIEI